jgi:hypothetical protein
MVLIAEVDAGSAVEAEIRVLALVRVDTLGGAKATLALRTAGEIINKKRENKKK